MKSAKILLLAIYLLGLGFLVVPQKVSAEDYVAQCCICRSYDGMGQLMPTRNSCTRYLTQQECSDKDTSVYSQDGTLTGTKCDFDACSVSPLCTKPQSTEVKRDAKLDPLKFNPNISVPGTDFKHSDDKKGGVPVTNSLLGDYIGGIYKFFVGIAGILAVIMIAIGGLLWLFSSGDSGKITKAKEIIIGAVVGLILVLGSYLILNTVNPALVSFKPLDVGVIGKAHVSDFCEPDAAVIVDGKKNIGQNLRCGEKATYENGQTCIGRGCPGEANGEVCYFNQGMQEARCLSCNETDDDLMDLYNIPKNDAGCALLTPNNQKVNHVQLCVFTESFGVDLNDDTCALIDVDCGNIKFCSDYNTKAVRFSDEWFKPTAELRHMQNVCSQDINKKPSRTGICPAVNPYGEFWLDENKICYTYKEVSLDAGTCKERSYGGVESQVDPGWAYDPGIQAQMVDASQDLISLLNCLRPKLDEYERQLSQPGSPKKIGKISSIGDSDYIGNLSACHVENQPAKCDHLFGSCHYGGDKNDGKSYAVDIGDEVNGEYIEIAAAECEHGYMALECLDANGQPKKDNDCKVEGVSSVHYHISTASCTQGE